MLEVMDLTIYWGFAKQFTKVGTCMVNAYPVVKFTDVIHMYFVMQNGLCVVN